MPPHISEMMLHLALLHHVDQGAGLPLPDDLAVLGVLHRHHHVHNLVDLRHLQVLHEVVVHDSTPGKAR